MITQEDAVKRMANNTGGVSLLRGWWLYGTALVAMIVFTLLLFQETVVSLVSIWWRSETFAHGFLIVPISLYLIWTRRHELARLTPRPSYWGIALLLLIGAGWFLARLVDVLVIQQLALVAMLPALVIGLLGWRVAWTIAFPLAYLIFAVPMGEGLIPPMMDFTAVFTVNALQLTGIPVYWEGTFFSIPSGDWSVVEGCSGVRYLIASVALGALYAYLTYRSYWRRAAFMVMAVVFPIIANGLRAYMIVMIAHLSDMKLALGVDHFVYGWVFFGLVMLLMFWIGSFWRDDAARSEETGDQEPRQVPVKNTANGKLATTMVATILVVTLWPAAAWQLKASNDGNEPRVTLTAPEIGNGWVVQEQALTGWSPRYQGMTAELQQTYVKDGQRVGLYLAYYQHGTGSGELINSQNIMVEQKHPVWQQTIRRVRPVSGVSAVDRVYQVHLRSSEQRLLVWHWDRVAGRHLTNAYLGKLWQAYARLTGRHEDSVGIVLFTEYGTRVEAAEEQLQAFLQDALPALETMLRDLESA